MSRHLLVLRHAEAASDTQEGLSDFERPLIKRGREDASQIGGWMKAHILPPEHIHVVSSPARRAQETMRIVANKLGFSESQIHWDARIYMADVSTLLRVLSECPSSAHTTLLVGHNPGLQKLLLFLCGKKQIEVKNAQSFSTTALAKLILPDSWACLEAQTAYLTSLIQGQDLK
jgi:phosphohistidine phosphatase